MERALYVLCLALAVTGLGINAIGAREWTDSTGTHSVEAEFLSVSDGVVRLKRTDRTIISVPIEKLSKVDRQYAQSQNEPRKEVQASDADLSGHADLIWYVTYSSDGRRIATASLDKTIGIWDTGNETLLFSLKGHTKEVYGVAFSPDCKQVLSGSDDCTVRLWDALTGKEVRRFQTVQRIEGPTKKKLPVIRCGVRSVAFSMDGSEVLATTQEGILFVWRTGTGERLYPRLFELAENHPTGIYIPHSRDILTGGENGAIRIWNTESQRQVQVLTGHTGAVYRVACSPDGQTVISGGEDGTVRVWDVKSGKEVRSLKGHEEGPVTCVAYSGDGRRALSCTKDGVRIWDAKSYNEVQLDFFDPLTFCAAFSPTENCIVTCDSSGNMIFRHLP